MEVKLDSRECDCLWGLSRAYRLLGGVVPRKDKSCCKPPLTNDEHYDSSRPDCIGENDIHAGDAVQNRKISRGLCHCRERRHHLAEPIHEIVDDFLPDFVGHLIFMVFSAISPLVQQPPGLPPLVDGYHRVLSAV